MPDFVQLGKIATLHNFGTTRQADLDDLLRQHTRQRKIGLILPLSSADLQAETFDRIIAELVEADYLQHIVVVLSMADQREYRETWQKMSPLQQRGAVLWADSPRMTQLYRSLDEEGMDLDQGGKGRSVWTGIGYLLSLPQIDVIGMHECDIVTYDRGIVARLFLPLVHQALDFEFCKAYYARYTTKLHGRVVRLLVAPLLEALMVMYSSNAFLSYLYSFRYLLSGEFAGAKNLLKSNRIPCDLGWEMGMLSEVYRNTVLKRVCQVDLCPQYEHKHQSLSLEDATSGLMRMSTEILATIFRTLAGMGIELTPSTFLTLRALYLRSAQDSVRKYHADSMMNGLSFDRHEEEQTVESFSRRIAETGDLFASDPLGPAPLPTWNRVLSAFPGFPSEIQQAVADDRKDALS
jgi:glucosyl-3-phosphoglycerate synthase